MEGQRGAENIAETATTSGSGEAARRAACDRLSIPWAAVGRRAGTGWGTTGGSWGPRPAGLLRASLRLCGLCV